MGILKTADVHHHHRDVVHTSNLSSLSLGACALSSTIMRPSVAIICKA